MKQHSSSWKLALIGSDALAIVVGFLLAYWVRFTSGWIPAPKGVPPLSQHAGFMLFVVVVWLALFRWFGLYRQRTQTPLDEAYSIMIGVGAGSVSRRCSGRSRGYA